MNDALTFAHVRKSVSQTFCRERTASLGYTVRNRHACDAMTIRLLERAIARAKTERESEAERRAQTLRAVRLEPAIFRKRARTREQRETRCQENAARRSGQTHATTSTELRSKVRFRRVPCSPATTLALRYHDESWVASVTRTDEPPFVEGLEGDRSVPTGGRCGGGVVGRVSLQLLLVFS